MKKNYIFLSVILLIFLGAITTAQVSHPAEEIAPGTFPAGDFIYQGNVELKKAGEVFLNVNNIEANGREYAIISAGSTGGIGVGKFSIYDKTLGVSRLTVDANGNIGLGTTNPLQKLDVLGSIKASGTICDVNGCIGSGSSGGGGEPVGIVQLYAGTSVPAGYLRCDGSAVSRNAYPDLFNAVGTTYGAGDGSTTFNLPDMGGRFGVGTGTLGTDTYSLGATGGEARHALTTPEMPAHTHGYTQSNTGPAEGGYQPSSWPGPGASTTGSTGGSQPHENRPPYMAFDCIIKAIPGGTSDAPTEYSGPLFNNAHTSDDCTAAAGEVVDDAGDKFCRFNLASCPGGWTLFKQWSNTVSTSCGGTNCEGGGGACSTGGHTWADQPIESCSSEESSSTYDPDWNQWNCDDWSVTCYATRTMVGCY